jgi:hypothetical protein
LRQSRIWLCVGVWLAFLVSAPAVFAQSTADASGSYGAEFYASLKPSNALDMVQRLPGFVLDEGNSDSRGLAGTGGNVLINGELPTTKNDPLIEVLKRISATSVERIDVIRGGTSDIDMHGRSVVANVILKRTALNETVLGVSTYLYSDGFLGPILDLETTRRSGDRTVEGSLHLTRDRTDQTYDGATRIRTDPAGTPILSAALKGYDTIYNEALRGAVEDRGFGGTYRLNGLVDHFKFDRQVSTLRLMPDRRLDTNAETYDQKKLELGLRYDLQLDATSDFQLVGLQTYQNSSYTSGFNGGGSSQLFSDDTTTAETVLRAELHRRPTASLSWEVGAEAAYNLLDESTGFVEDGTIVDLPAASVKVEEYRAEVFGKTTFQIRSDLKLEAGTRLEFSRISQSGDTNLSKTFVYPKPRWLLTWQASPVDQIRLRIEEEVGQLNFGDFVSSAGVETSSVDAGNPDLKPDKTLVTDLTYERKFWKDAVFTINYVHGDIRDAADLIPISGQFDAPGNIGNARNDQLHVGLTSSLDQIGFTGGQVRLSGNWRKSEVTDPVTGRTRPLSNQRPRDCDLRVTQDVPGGHWSWGVTYFCKTGRSVYRINEVRSFEQQAWLESFVEWKPVSSLSIRLELSNLLGQDNVRHRQIYVGPRSQGQLEFAETRRIPFEPFLFLKIRKTFS